MLCLFLCAIGFMACSDDDKKTEELYPLRFVPDYQEVRLFQTENISFVDGGGEYTVRVENPELVEANVKGDWKTVSITGKKKGETTITITDHKAGGEARLKVKVVDSYMGFEYVNGDTLFSSQDRFLFLVDNEQKDFYMFRRTDNYSGASLEVVVKGNYQLTQEGKVPCLTFIIQQGDEEAEIYRYNLSESTAEVFLLMNKLINAGWTLGSKATRDIGARNYFLSLKEEDVHSSLWRIDGRNIMPTGILE